MTQDVIVLLILIGLGYKLPGWIRGLQTKDKE